MRRVRSVLPPLLLLAGAAAIGWGCYGAGILRPSGGAGTQWLQVAALLIGGVGLLCVGFALPRRTNPSAEPSIAAEIAALEALVPTVRRHPEGVAALQDLVEVVFEAHLKFGAAAPSETPLKRRVQGGADHA